MPSEQPLSREGVHSSTELQQIYQTRFGGKSHYRQAVWRVLGRFFARWIPADATVLDLGCGHCEFINAVAVRRKYAMDLNPDARALARPGVTVILQDCSVPWNIEPNTLDAVFSSNFLEHLPDKPSLERTLQHAWGALRPNGIIVLMGPNIKYVPGAYWDFFDHYLALTELSVAEVLKKTGFTIECCVARFLPYTMSVGRTYPVWMLKAYLTMPWIWRFFGKQFLVVARKNVKP
jgi:SAM-dependent methyltransferase